MLQSLNRMIQTAVTRLEKLRVFINYAVDQQARTEQQIQQVCFLLSIMAFPYRFHLIDNCNTWGTVIVHSQSVVTVRFGNSNLKCEHLIEEM